MRKQFFLFSTVLLMASLFSTTLQAQWSEAKLQSMYSNFLDGKGYENSIDGDGDVQFIYNDRTFFIEVNEGDTEFFRVVLANIWPIESVSEGLQVVQACDEVNRTMKCTKAYTTNDNVWVAVELFVGEPDVFKAVFDRCLNAIELGVTTFVDEM
ncbi:MAG: YbjN domain-containing protein [Lewinella sp.]|jgi:hypothetical protein|uniref:YbjN domain-containing protein n=1 Tax=Lewinella sp. TaxID=2004506 RepID=UPI003D6C314E